MIAAGRIAGELAAGARYLGSTLLLTQGAGGNNSVKDPETDTLWIKASGMSLSRAANGEGFVALDLCKAQRIVRDSQLRSLASQIAQEISAKRFLAAVRGGSTLRPSLETGMHLSLPQRVVLHTHSVYLNAFACMQAGKEAAAAYLPEHQWIPYSTPGFSLAVAIETSATGRSTGPMAIILENHGFISAAPSSEEGIAISEQFVEASRNFFGPLDPGWSRVAQPSKEALELAELARRSSADSFVRPGRFAVFRQAAGILAGCSLSPFVPDDVVYLGPKIWSVPARAQAIPFLRRMKDAPPRFALAIPEVGMIFGAENEGLLEAMEEAALAHLLIAILIARRGAPSSLTAASVQEIVTMESENYRQRIAGSALREAAPCRS